MSPENAATEELIRNAVAARAKAKATGRLVIYDRAIYGKSGRMIAFILEEEQPRASEEIAEALALADELGSALRNVMDVNKVPAPERRAAWHARGWEVYRQAITALRKVGLAREGD